MRTNWLKLRLNIGRGLSLRIIERPGLSLPPEERDALLADLRTVARHVLPDADLTYGVLSGAPERLEKAVVTMIHERASGAPVAFNCLSIMTLRLAGRPVDVLHLGLVMIDPALRGRGLSDILYGLTCVLLFLRRQCRPVRLSNVTQVPAVLGMVAETFDGVFPKPGHTADPRFEHRILARQIMAEHRGVFGVGAEAAFDERRSIIVNAYTGGSDGLKKSFDEAPKHRHAVYNELCARELDYARGDDFLQLGQINMDAARRYLSRIVRPQSMPWLAGQLILFAIQSAIMPLLHWYADDEQMGVLRPWRRPA